VRRLACVAVLVALGALALPARAAAAISCDPADTICQDLNDAKGSQADQQSKLDQIKKNIKDVQDKEAAIAGLILQLKRQIDVQNGAIAQTQTEIDETERQIRFTEAEIARREAHLQVREQLLNQRVRAMDKHGTVNYFELLVTSTSFSQLIDRVVIMQDIIRSDRRLLEDLRQERLQLQRLRGDLKQKRVDQEVLLRKQRDQRAQLLQLKAQQDAALAYQQSLEAQFDEQRRAVEAEKARIDALITQLQKQYDQEGQQLGGGTGQFGWPENYHYITQPFGCSDLWGEPYSATCASHHTHTGIDIGGPYGAPIFAADNGVVSLVTPAPGGGYGNYVIITHGSGYATLYAHMSSYAVRPGQQVQRGQRIGFEGSTGYSTGPHLHFEIRFNGGYLNPCSFLGC